jgi:hypothetical protein
VCVKCIYDDHNGHHLMQVEEMCKLDLTAATSLKQNIADLQKMLKNTKRLVEENQKLIE